MTTIKAPRVVVTGGAGFIGSNIVRALNEAGETQILIVDHLTDTGKWKNLVDIRFADYMDRADFLYALKRDEIDDVVMIVHMGACTDTTYPDESYLIHNNALYSKHLFSYCSRRGVRFIYASSAATYGDGRTGYSEDEDDHRPLNCYGYSKYLFDQWVLRSRETPRQWVGLRFFNVYGPHEDHKRAMASFVFQCYSQILTTGRVRLFKSYRTEYADGKQLRDFIYVKDIVKVVQFFMEHGEKNGIVNVGTGEARTYLDVARCVYHTLEREPAIDFIEMPEGLKHQYQYSTRASVEKLRAFGYTEPFSSLEAGVQDYVTGYLAHVREGLPD